MVTNMPSIAVMTIVISLVSVMLILAHVFLVQFGYDHLLLS